MNAIWSPYLFGPLTILGLALLITSVAKLVGIYTTGPHIEWEAQSYLFDFDLKEIGIYEISVKRKSIFGVIPKNTSFQVTNRQTGASIAVEAYRFLTSKRTDMGGNRIVPVAELSITQPGTFRLVNPSTEHFTETDRFVLAPKIGGMGILMILATVFTGILFIASLVFFILSFINK